MYVCSVCNLTNNSMEFIITHYNTFHNFQETPVEKSAFTILETQSANQSIDNSDFNSTCVLDNKSPENNDSKIWSNENTFSLIEKIKKYEKDFENSIKRSVWNKISNEMSAKGVQVTAIQSDNKWRSLKRTYKNILVHNDTSGKERKNWEYFKAIHEFMYKKPEITPIATCSSIDGLLCSDSSSSGDVVNTEAVEHVPPKRRKPNENAVERRHKERMERQDRFLDLFSTLIQKM